MPPSLLPSLSRFLRDALSWAVALRIAWLLNSGCCVGLLRAATYILCGRRCREPRNSRESPPNAAWTYRRL
jgi:hypothetical protein